MKIYTLYLNTESSSLSSYKPIKAVNNDSGNVSWFIDWDNLFGKNHQYKTARVKFILKSKTSTPNTYVYNSDTSNLRCNLNSNYQNQINLCSLGFVEPALDPINSSNLRIQGDTTSTNGVMVNIPSGLSHFNIQFIGFGETVSTIPDDYSIMIFFEIDE